MGEYLRALRSDERYDTHRRICAACHAAVYPVYMGLEAIHWFELGAVIYFACSGFLATTLFLMMLLGARES